MICIDCTCQLLLSYGCFLSKFTMFVGGEVMMTTRLKLGGNLEKSFLNNFHAATAAKSLQSCPTLCDPIDRSPPDSPVPGILQARTLEWVAISFPNPLK